MLDISFNWLIVYISSSTISYIIISYTFLFKLFVCPPFYTQQSISTNSSSSEIGLDDLLFGFFKTSTIIVARIMVDVTAKARIGARARASIGQKDCGTYIQDGYSRYIISADVDTDVSWPKPLGVLNIEIQLRISYSKVAS